jgi:hypothetical protein
MLPASKVIAVVNCTGYPARSRVTQARSIRGSCRRPADQRYNARCLGFELQILYPFHPQWEPWCRCSPGSSFGGEAHFVIRQLDGTLTLLPGWMVGPAAASFRVIPDPRPPADRLLDVLDLVDSLLASWPRESSQLQEASIAGTAHRQRALIESPLTPTSIPIHDQQQMLQLLMETEPLTCGLRQEDVDEENDVDQDHA